MANPTVVVLTDRNDLDHQLYNTFSRCHDLLRQPPVQAESRAGLRARLAVESGGVIFTTIQKFLAPLTAPSSRPLPGRKGSNGKDDRQSLLSKRRKHRSHRGRSAPQPVRLSRRVRAPHARRPAQCLLRGFHRHVGRTPGCQHSRRIRRLYQYLRCPTRRRGQGDGSDLL